MASTPPPPPPDIVVTGRIDSNNVMYRWDDRTGNSGPYVAPQPSDDPRYADYKEIRTHFVERTSKSGQARQAARKFLERANSLQNLINSLVDQSPVTILGYSIAPYEIYGSIDRTTVRFVDNNNFQNTGVGQAYWSDGEGLDTIDYHAIVNDDNTGYGSTNYENQEGMNAVVLHEFAGHLNDEAKAFFDANVTAWRADPKYDHTNSNYFYGVNGQGTAYSRNVEAFANDVMVAFAARLQLDIQTSQGVVVPGGYTNAIDPAQIKNDPNRN